MVVHDLKEPLTSLVKDSTAESLQDQNQEYFKYNQIYYMFRIPFRLERFLLWNFFFQIQALLYTLTVLPLRVALTLLNPFSIMKLNGRRQAEIMRVLVILVSTLLLTRVSNSSVIYHWIRGQSLFKLYMIKAVFEISDLLLKGFG